MNSRIFLLLTLLLGIFGPLIGGPKPTKLTPQVKIDTAKDLKGKVVQLFAAKTDRATLLLFTAHDCPISNQYAPEINRISKRFKPLGVRIYLIYTETDLNREDAKKHFHDFGYSCDALLDPEHKLVKYAGATVTPEAALYNSKGKLTYRGRIDNLYPELGKRRYAATEHNLIDALISTLAGKPTKSGNTKAIGCFITQK